MLYYKQLPCIKDKSLSMEAAALSNFFWCIQYVTASLHPAGLWTEKYTSFLIHYEYEKGEHPAAAGCGKTYGIINSI